MKWAILRFAWSKAWPIAALLIAVVLGGAWVMGYQTGKSAERTMQELRHAQVLEAARMEQERLADELEAAKAERRIVYRDRIRYVDRVVDDCADVPVPDGVRESLPGGGNG